MQVAHVVHAEQLITVFHFVQHPLERLGGVPVVGDDGMAHVGKGVVHRQLDHFGIDHEHLELALVVAVYQGGDDGVDAHGFAGTGGAGDEEVGHLREVGHYGPALEVGAECDGEPRPVGIPGRGAEQLGERHHPGRGVRHLDPDEGLARNGGDDADRLGLHLQRQVVGQRGDASHFHTGRRREFELCDHGSGGAMPSQRHVHLERFQCVDQNAAEAIQLRFVLDSGIDLSFVQQAVGEWSCGRLADERLFVAGGGLIGGGPRLFRLLSSRQEWRLELCRCLAGGQLGFDERGLVGAPIPDGRRFGSSEVFQRMPSHGRYREG